MKEKVQHKKYATDLRLAGSTYSEILAQVPVSRGTLSAWLSDVPLPENVVKHLSANRRARVSQARRREATVRKAAAIVRRGFAEKGAKKEFERHSKEPFFLAGLGLYLGGGTFGKASFSYMSGEERQIALMVRWAKEYLAHESRIALRLYLPPSMDLGSARVHWSKATGLPAAAFKKAVMTKERARKPSNYAGIARLELTGGRAALRVRVWLDMLVVRYAE
ncbi:MAG: hypothetical protein KBC38_03015 [Candidatus Pacebacteria bacterium]|nr:hypothetical protein [Candidatus Paceibacterota bacterium]MBP9840116.1 hypothetical protein [Candidatus Paceibacterota bacterium]